MIAFDPSSRYEFTLTPYEGEPAQSRPTFIARHMTVRERQRFIDLWGNAPEEQAAANIDEAIGIALVGWRNVTDAANKPVEFSASRVVDVLTAPELSELLVRLWNAGALTDDQRKNFGTSSLLSMNPGCGAA